MDKNTVFLKGIDFKHLGITSKDMYKFLINLLSSNNKLNVKDPVVEDVSQS